MSNSNKSSNGEGVSNTSLLIFKRKNYIILLIGIITLIIGFILLSGGGSEGYDYNEQIFSFQRRVLAPIIIIIALILCGISIMIKK